MREVHLLIDGYNVIHAWPQMKKVLGYGWSAACSCLVEKIRIIHDSENIRVTVVFDGRGDKVEIERPGTDLTFSLIYTPRHLSADAVIEQLVEKSKNQDMDSICVVTADNALAQTVRTLGKLVLFPDELINWVNRCEEGQQHAITKIKKMNQVAWRR